MPHFLTTVRTAVVGVVTGLVTTGNRVYTRHHYPWQAGQLPGLVVLTSAPEVEAVDIDNPPTLRVDTMVDVDCICASNADAAALLDTIATEVMTALHGLSAIGGKPVVVVTVSIGPPQFNGEVDPPVTRRGMRFAVPNLFVRANAPDTLV